MEINDVINDASSCAELPFICLPLDKGASTTNLKIFWFDSARPCSSYHEAMYDNLSHKAFDQQC